ncbi:ribonuclease HIII [Mycoplasma sp. 1781]
MMTKDSDYIGVDETGVCDYFAPIVSVACFIPEENIQLIKNLGVKDSKKLSDSKIMGIAEYIIKNNVVLFKDTTMSQKGYNNLIKFGINNNAVKTLIHMNSIDRLQNIVKNNKKVVIDQYTTLNKFNEHIANLYNKNLIKKNIFERISLVQETKAEDKFLSVACASILARYILLKKMEAQKANYDGFDFILGASDLVIKQGVSFVKKFGISELYNVAKFQFKTTKKILEELEK